MWANSICSVCVHVPLRFYVRMCVYVYVCAYVCVCIYVCGVCICVCICVSVHVCLCVCVNTSVFVFVYECVLLVHAYFFSSASLVATKKLHNYPHYSFDSFVFPYVQRYWSPRRLTKYVSLILCHPYSSPCNNHALLHRNDVKALATIFPWLPTHFCTDVRPGVILQRKKSVFIFFVSHALLFKYGRFMHNCEIPLVEVSYCVHTYVSASVEYRFLYILYACSLYTGQCVFLICFLTIHLVVILATKRSFYVTRCSRERGKYKGGTVRCHRYQERPVADGRNATIIIFWLSWCQHFHSHHQQQCNQHRLLTGDTVLYIILHVGNA